ncbi:MAG: DUF2243 domain-containing protein [Actinomycetota bacterium]|nr:DUF2243 domain-containing protein [Actinomycetota bacterium]
MLHQLLQWHHLWSRRTSDATVAGLEDNTFADGVFHTVTLVVLVGGIGLLVGRRVEARALVGLALVGWGTFHVVDQLLFHLALGAHHIREHVADPELYDWAFFAIGLALIALGASIARSRPGAQLAGDRL